MKGIAYGVGVGPGDPELMTCKAIRLIRENHVIAVPGTVPEEAVSYQIAAAAVPEIAGKELLPVSMPMSNDPEVIREAHQKGARQIEGYLDQGKNVVYLTLGDPTIYCSFSYLQQILGEDGYRTELVNGVPSFCAAAARLNRPLAQWDEPVHLVPAAHNKEQMFSEEGNYVLMKSAGSMKEVKKLLLEKGFTGSAVENCGMDNEKVYLCLEEIPENAGYLTLVIASGK